MTTIVVPLDGSPVSERALRPACALAARFEAGRLLLVRCAPDDADAAQRELDDRASQYSSIVDVDTRIVDAGEPAEQLLAVAMAEHGGLLCMATHGRGSLGAALLGSTATDIVRRSERPVVLIGPSCNTALLPGERGRLLACSDGSDFSNSVVAVASTWCDHLDLEPWLTEVVGPDEEPRRPHESIPNREVSAATARLGELATRFTEPDSVGIKVLSGVPGRSIPSFAERLPAALIAIATHGRTGLGRVAMGSVATEIVRQAPCPVLVTRPTTDEDEPHRATARMPDVERTPALADAGKGYINVGVDGSANSRAALRWAAGIAAAQNRRLRVINAWQYPATAATPAGPQHLPDPTEMDARTTAQLRAILRDELVPDTIDAEVDAEVEVGRGPAAPVLVAASARTSTEMLVLGARGLGGVRGLLLGSVSQQCVEHGSCPVVVLRGDDVTTVGPCVVGVDGSDGASRALHWAADLAAATGSKVVAVHAPDLADDNITMDTATRAADQWCAQLAERGISYDVHVEAGDARVVLERVGTATNAWLVVVGSRGLGAIRGLVLGSVAGYMVRHSQRPIAVVPPPRT